MNTKSQAQGTSSMLYLKALGNADPDGIRYAKQGVRQKAWITSPPFILNAGDFFCNINDIKDPQYQTIPDGCIGVVHDDGDFEYGTGEVSVIRDDCQAARRAKRKAAEALDRFNQIKRTPRVRNSIPELE